MDWHERQLTDTLWKWFRDRHNENKTARAWARQMIRTYAGYIRQRREFIANSGANGGVCGEVGEE